MTKWERLEEYLFDHEKEGSDFSAHEYAAATDLETWEATEGIQCYLGAQRAPKSRTLYVLRRQPGTRTKNARWAVGVKTKDARLIGRALADDTAARVKRAFVPDLVRLRTINPRAARKVEAQITSVVDHAIAILVAAAEGVSDEE